MLCLGSVYLTCVLQMIQLDSKSFIDAEGGQLLVDLIRDSGDSPQNQSFHDKLIHCLCIVKNESSVLLDCYNRGLLGVIINKLRRDLPPIPQHQQQNDILPDEAIVQEEIQNPPDAIPQVHEVQQDAMR